MVFYYIMARYNLAKRHNLFVSWKVAVDSQGILYLTDNPIRPYTRELYIHQFTTALWINPTENVYRTKVGVFSLSQQLVQVQFG